MKYILEPVSTVICSVGMSYLRFITGSSLYPGGAGSGGTQLTSR